MPALETFGRIGAQRSMDGKPVPRGLMTQAGAEVFYGARAMDMFTNMPARMGWGTPSLAESAEYNLVRLSYDYWLLITLYRNHWISRRITDAPAEDMVRAWPKLTGDMTPKQLAKFDRVIQKTGTQQRLLEALKWGRLFGGGGALIVIDGHEDHLEEPLGLDDVELGSYRGLIPFDRWVGIQPEADLCVDITRPLDFNLPEMYRVTSTQGQTMKVHASRILRFTGPAVPSPEYEAQQWWGISVLEPVYEEIRKRDNMSWTILSRTFRSSILAMTVPGLGEMLSGASMNQASLQKFYERMQAFNQLLSNQGLVVLPKEGQMQSVSAGNDSGVADIYQQFQLDIAGAAEMPVSRLFGRTITGLAQTNDADERMYEQRIAKVQNNELRPQLDKLFPVIAMSEWGEVPEDMGMQFPSVRVLTEEEKADLAQKSSQAVLGALNGGVIDQVMAMKELKQSSDITGIFTNITDEDVADKEKEVEDQKKLMESMPDLGGLLRPGEQEGGGNGKSPFASLQSMAGESAAKKKKAADSAEVASFEFAGIPVTVEYPAGSRRRFRNDQGSVVYDRLLKHDYGFIDGTMGRDGDEIDVILGPDEDSGLVFVADMHDLGVDVDKREDEDKVLLGFTHRDDSRRAFCTMYPPEFLAGLEQFAIEDFIENWLGRTKPPGLRACKNRTQCCSNCAYFDGFNHRCQMFGGYPVTGGQTCEEWVGGTPGTMRAQVGDWAESEHPRVPEGREGGGRFAKKGSGGGGGASNASAKLQPAPLNREKWPKHIKKLRIPPAWTGVRINPDPKGDLQAVGTDIKGRQQYLYSEEFKKRRAGEKFARIKTLSKRFGEIERQNQQDLRSKDPARRENAACARLVMKLGLRPGSDKDTKAAVQAHGATTLEGRHVVERRGQVYLKFVGKKGVSLDIPVEDPDLAKMLADRADRAGRSGKLFPDVTDKSLLDYTHSLDGGKFKTKDLRTHIANEIASSAMQDLDPPTSEKEYKKRCKEVAAVVAEKLGNTPTVALQSYINPEVFAPWRAAVEMGPAAKPAQPKAKEFRKSWVKPRNKRLSGAEVKDLASTVLSNGGKTVETDAGDYDQWQLPDRGEFKSGKTAKLGKTEPNSCHGMAARAWKAGLGTLYTGFARGIKEPGDRAYEESDAWVMHSWVVDPKGNVIEGTPYLREGYYGYPMTDKEADKFWRTNRDNVSSKGFKTY